MAAIAVALIGWGGSVWAVAVLLMLWGFFSTPAPVGGYVADAHATR